MPTTARANSGPRSKTFALHPVDCGPGVLVHSSADRRLAVEHWLLSAARDPHKARQEWDEHGVAILPLGGIMSAVRLPARLVLAAADEREAPSSDVDAFLAEALEGPVICDTHGRRYYALVPSSMPRTCQAVADMGQAEEADVLGRDSYLGFPRVDRDEYDPVTRAPYWAVPMPSLGELCSPLLVARLIAAGRHMLAKEDCDVEA